MDIGEAIKEYFDQSEWKPVVALDGRGYWEGFDREREYEFRRFPDKEIFMLTMADQSPYFNIAGLYWRPIP